MQVALVSIVSILFRITTSRKKNVNVPCGIVMGIVDNNFYRYVSTIFNPLSIIIANLEIGKSWKECWQIF